MCGIYEVQHDTKAGGVLIKTQEVFYYKNLWRSEGWSVEVEEEYGSTYRAAIERNYIQQKQTLSLSKLAAHTDTHTQVSSKKPKNPLTRVGTSCKVLAWSKTEVAAIFCSKRSREVSSCSTEVTAESSPTGEDGKKNKKKIVPPQNDSKQGLWITTGPRLPRNTSRGGVFLFCEAGLSIRCQL